MPWAVGSRCLEGNGQRMYLYSARAHRYCPPKTVLADEPKPVKPARSEGKLEGKSRGEVRAVLVEEVLDCGSFQDPVHGGGLEGKLSVALPTEGGAHVLEQIERRRNVFDHVPAYDEIRDTHRGLPAVELADERDAAVVDGVGTHVRGIEAHSAIVARRAEAPEELALPAPDFHHELVSDP